MQMYVACDEAAKDAVLKDRSSVEFEVLLAALRVRRNPV